MIVLLVLASRDEDPSVFQKVGGVGLALLGHAPRSGPDPGVRVVDLGGVVPRGAPVAGPKSPPANHHDAPVGQQNGAVVCASVPHLVRGHELTQGGGLGGLGLVGRRVAAVSGRRRGGGRSPARGDGGDEDRHKVPQ